MTKVKFRTVRAKRNGEWYESRMKEMMILSGFESPAAIRNHNFLMVLCSVFIRLFSGQLQQSRQRSLFFNIYIYLFILFIYLVAPGLICGTWAPLLQLAGKLWHACGSQFPNQGSNPGPLHWECRVLTTVPPGKSLGRGFVVVTLQPL